jgi:hypothetical protein
MKNNILKKETENPQINSDRRMFYLKQSTERLYSFYSERLL